MKEKLLIIGAGNIGGYISYNIEDFGDYDVLGFLDDNPDKIGKKMYAHQVLGNIASIDEHLHEGPVSVVVGIANPKIKDRIVRFLKTKEVRFPNFIAPDVWLSRKVDLGEGIILYPGVCINYETVLGDFVIMNMNCSIGHNCHIETGSTLAPGVNFAGFTHSKPFADIGIGASTIQGVSIGEFSRIGGQSILIKDIPDYAVAVGNPGRVIRIDQS
ncbi:acetyltransferase [Flavobacterium sp.]|uniref:acetyltransferase n=1 Tax=Flavobacterium sp. TaxID=239 RepID=UPI0026055525|nr:acetyltransferase [Flavobacterium sp.]